MDFITNVGMLGVVFVAGCIIGFIVLVFRCIRKVEQGKALIINRFVGEPVVKFTGGIVYPVIHKAEYMDISLKTIEIGRMGVDGLICRDNIRADIKVVFFVRVNKTEGDVMKVAQSIGCERASTRETLENLFQAKFSEALKTVGKQMDFVDLYKERTLFKEEIIKNIGEDLNGYRLEDVAIDYLEQTPVEKLDPDNILDSQGIKKIRELTAEQKIKANEIKRNEEKVIKKQDVEAREQILALEKQQAEAEYKQKKEIENVRVREETEVKKVTEEERLKSESARINTEQEVAIAEENKQRQIIIAQKNKEKVEAVEQERVLKEQELERTQREKEVAIVQINKDIAVEEEKKKIQDAIRERVKVERTVAEEEEKIKDTHEIAEAKRAKEISVIDATRDAEEKLVKTIKSAEAAAQSAIHLAEEKKTMAAAEQEAAIKLAEAKKILAEGVIAEEAATGLASIKIKEAEAEMIEKKGKAEAAAKEMNFKADAIGIHEKGKAESFYIGETQKAKAVGIESVSKAEAISIQEKATAEAKGIQEKAEAMKLFDGVGREHEEFKLKLNKQERVELAEINIQKEIAKEQASLVAEGLKSAKIEIVGGENDFFEKVVKSISYGKATKKFLISSELNDMLSNAGNGTLIDQLKALIQEVGIKSQDIKNLTIAALLTKVASAAKTDEERQKIQNLLQTSKQVGLGDTIAGWLIH